MAHLILFPDILNEIDGKGELNGAGELPVRKRPVPLSGNSSSVSGLTSSGANMSIGSNSHHKRFSPDPDAYVDLEENAFVRVKLEYCSEGERRSLHQSEQKDDGSTLVLVANKVNGKAIPASPYDLVKDAGDLVDQTDSLIGQVANISSHGFDQSLKDDPHQSPNLEDAKENLNKLNNERTSAAEVICAVGLDLDGLLKSFQGMIGYCGDDAGVYQGLGGAASMDSTIYTHRSINI